MQPYPFSAIVGQDEMKQAMILTAIDASIGGVLVFGDRGTGKSTAVRAFAQTLDHNLYPVVYLSNPHLGVTALYRARIASFRATPPPPGWDGVTTADSK